MEVNESGLLTLGEIAREAFPDIPIHRLKYAIDNYHILPIRRAGILRMFSREQVPAMRSALARIASRREVAHA